MTDPQMPLVLPSPILRSRRVIIKRSRHVLPRVVWSHLMLGVQTWWARQDSNLRPLGCKPADHRPNPIYQQQAYIGRPHKYASSPPIIAISCHESCHERSTSTHERHRSVAPAAAGAADVAGRAREGMPPFDNLQTGYRSVHLPRAAQQHGVVHRAFGHLPRHGVGGHALGHVGLDEPGLDDVASDAAVGEEVGGLDRS
jgi:hypothetical protein